MASYQYVYVMQNLTKVFPGGRELFKDRKSTRLNSSHRQ